MALSRMRTNSSARALLTIFKDKLQEHPLSPEIQPSHSAVPVHAALLHQPRGAVPGRQLLRKRAPVLAPSGGNRVLHGLMELWQRSLSCGGSMRGRGVERRGCDAATQRLPAGAKRARISAAVI